MGSHKQQKGKVMTDFKRIAIVGVVGAALCAIVVVKHRERSAALATQSKAPAVAANSAVLADDGKTAADTSLEKPAATPASLPKLVDLGASKCIPCKMMAPILEELETTFAGKLKVEFIDVWKNPEAGQKYGVRVIPTQIFYDADGVERFRHEGFFAREDILAKWKALGVELETGAAANATPEERD
jgi:thioredoxin 1